MQYKRKCKLNITTNQLVAINADNIEILRASNIQNICNKHNIWFTLYYQLLEIFLKLVNIWCYFKLSFCCLLIILHCHHEALFAIDLLQFIEMFCEIVHDQFVKKNTGELDTVTNIVDKKQDHIENVIPIILKTKVEVIHNKILKI